MYDFDEGQELPACYGTIQEDMRMYHDYAGREIEDTEMDAMIEEVERNKAVTHHHSHWDYQQEAYFFIVAAIQATMDKHYVKGGDRDRRGHLLSNYAAARVNACIIEHAAQLMTLAQAKTQRQIENNAEQLFGYGSEPDLEPEKKTFDFFYGVLHPDFPVSTLSEHDLPRDVETPMYNPYAGCEEYSDADNAATEEDYSPFDDLY